MPGGCQQMELCGAVRNVAIGDCGLDTRAWKGWKVHGRW